MLQRCTRSQPRCNPFTGKRISFVSCFQHKIYDIHQQLTLLPSLEPRDEVNQLFSNLVNLVIDEDTPDVVEDVLSDPHIQSIQSSLHQLSARGEYQLERYWSNQISAHQEPAAEMKRFPYYGNYEQLSDMEFNALSSLNDGEIQKVLFVGSGPLPLSSILFAQKFGVPIDNVEVDQEAYCLSEKLAQKLHLSETLTFYHTDILQFTELAQYDVIFVAALAGLAPEEKSAIIRHLKMHIREGALLAIRTVHGLKTLLYPEVALDDLIDFKHQATIKPHNEIINSVLIVEKIVKESTT
ncbi:MAG: nicotianamine synthase [Chloroflexi bacterium]|nr:MAG: nicotianamine synthase [Chloroflexota bacterium]